MNVISASIILGISIAGLVVSSQVTVDSASKIARRLGVTEAIIGFIMLAFATSIPEMAVTVTSSAERQIELAVGNIIGSNIANIGLIIGLPVLILGLSMKSFKIDLHEMNKPDIRTLYYGLLVSIAVPPILVVWIYPSQPLGISLIIL